jgi:2-polyprenyl-6-hydroxyphenyl methylase/3-demethylubiquinone-9 3-methyltransferase
MSSQDLLDVRSHFAFGRNWANYAATIGDEQISRASEGLQRLAGEKLRGARFLDIGSGSGLHSLAALKLGAREVLAVDLDEHSVGTTQAVLERHAPSASWQVQQSSVFDLDRHLVGEFDIVYSWGVLHHTGDLDRALRATATFVKPDGILCVALYRRTLMCPFWKREKNWYSRAGDRGQRFARGTFVALLRIKLALQGKSLKHYTEAYGLSNRGMDFWHDLHDWLGGYPYESIAPHELHAILRTTGLVAEREFVDGKKRLGLFGSGCDEYVFRRP